MNTRLWILYTMGILSINHNLVCMCTINNSKNYKGKIRYNVETDFALIMLLSIENNWKYIKLCLMLKERGLLYNLYKMVQWQMILWQSLILIGACIYYLEGRCYLHILIYPERILTYAFNTFNNCKQLVGSSWIIRFNLSSYTPAPFFPPRPWKSSVYIGVKSWSSYSKSNL